MPAVLAMVISTSMDIMVVAIEEVALGRIRKKEGIPHGGIC